MVIDDGVDCAVDAGIVLMRKVNEPLYRLDVVASLRARAKGVGANINCVGTMLDGLDANVLILGWREKFYVDVGVAQVSI